MESSSGGYKELTAKGYPKTGTENYGGPPNFSGKFDFYWSH